MLAAMTTRLTMMLIAAAVAASRPALAGSVEHGRAIAATNCAACHSIDRTGASPYPKAPPFRTLGQSYPVENLEESLAEGIVTGHRNMPQFQMSPGDVDDFIAYLRSIQVGLPVTPATAR